MLGVLEINYGKYLKLNSGIKFVKKNNEKFADHEINKRYNFLKILSVSVRFTI